jgi:hypothetical protein
MDSAENLLLKAARENNLDKVQAALQKPDLDVNCAKVKYSKPSSHFSRL